MEKINKNPIINHGIDTKQFSGNKIGQSNKYLASNQTNFNQGSLSDKTLFNSGEQIKNNLDGKLLARASRESKFPERERRAVDRSIESNYSRFSLPALGDRTSSRFIIGNVTDFTQGDERWGGLPYRFSRSNSDMLNEGCSITAYTNAINAVNSNNGTNAPIINPQDTNLASDAFVAASGKTRSVDLLGNGKFLEPGNRRIPISVNDNLDMSLPNRDDKKYTSRIVEELRKGNPVLIGLSSPPDSNGRVHRHTVTAYGISDGKILVVDAGGGKPIYTTLGKIAKDWNSSNIDMIFAIRKR
jgi:hypothetical protein